MNTFRSEVRLSTLALVTIGMFDLVTTLMWLHLGFGEGNPAFAAIAQNWGSVGLALAKLLFLAAPIALLEYARQRRPVSAELGTWVAAGLYGFLYASHLIQLGA